MKETEIIRLQDGGSNVTGVPLDLGDIRHFSIEVDFTGDLAGTLRYYAGNKLTTLKEVSGAQQAVASGEDHLWNFCNANYRFARVDWERSSGSGTIIGRAVLKENPVIGA